MSGRQSGRAGFTLFEMLVAMALISMILASFGALFYRLERTDAAIGRMEGAENVEIVRRFLRQSLEASRPFPAPGPAQRPHFLGEPNRVVFTAFAAGERATGGIYETEFRLDDGGRLLMLRQLLGRGSGIPRTREVLLQNLATLSFAYLACPSPIPAAAVPRWSDDRQLPYLVAIKAAFRPGDPRSWGDVIAFLPAAACPGMM